MASSLAFFDRELSLAMTDLQPEALQKELAAFARKSVAEVIAAGQAPAEYQKFVNGREGAAEETVEFPGPIVYLFSNWKIAIQTAIEELQRRVPHRTGRYAGSFVVIVNGRATMDFSGIPPKSEVVIINRQPYTRKMETGANGTGARHFDLSKGAFNRRFAGVFNAQVVFLNVTGGIAQGVPYILKGAGSDNSVKTLADWHGVPTQVIQGWRKQGKKIAGPPTKSRRPDRQAGMPITYPALVINPD